MTKPDARTSVIAAARRAGEASGVSPAVLLAVAIVETDAVPFAEFDGRREPLVRFEGHVFDRLLAPGRREAARAAGLASPRAGAIPNPAAQSARWRLLARAAAIDSDAAHAATSWGLGQVMGFHAEALGYESADALAADARESIDGQFRLVARFLRRGDVHHRLEAGDVEAFARAYNGPAFRRHAYDVKIARAFAIARRWLAEEAVTGASGARMSDGPGLAKAGPNAAKGWSKPGGGLSQVISWLFHRFSIRAPMRSFSISTGPSSASPTTPPPSVSNPASSTS